MALSIFIFWCNFAIWLLPPFRQYGGKYFKYFLILSLIDPAAFISTMLFRVSIIKIFIIFSYLLLLSLINIRSRSKNIIIHIAGLLFLILLSWKLDREILTSCILIIHFVIMLMIIKEFMIKLGSERLISLFLLALSFYEMTVIIKVFAGLTKPAHYIAFYYATTGFEILLAIFFFIFRSDDKAMCLNLSVVEDVQS